MPAWLTLLMPVLLALTLLGLLALVYIMIQTHRDLAAALADLDASQTLLQTGLQTLLTRPTPPETQPAETPWLGAFLPTDAHAAQIERQVLEAEDHAVSAAGPIRFSSRGSRTSAQRFAPGGSTPPARSSGRK